MNKITLEKLCEIVKVISVNNLSKDTELDYFNIVTLSKIKNEKNAKNPVYFITYAREEEVNDGWYLGKIDSRPKLKKKLEKHPERIYMLDKTMIDNLDVKQYKIIVVEDLNDAIDALFNYFLSRSKAKTIAVTGSVGKTTCVGLIESVLKQKYKVMRIYAKRITPLVLKAYIINLLPEDIDYIVIENSIYYHDHVKILADLLKPEIAAILNIESSHLGIEKLKTMDDICKYKSLIMQYAKYGYIIKDDEYLDRLHIENSKLQYDKDTILTNNKLELERLDIGKIKVEGEMFNINNEFIVKPFILTTLAQKQCIIAYAIAKKLGLTSEQIKYGIENYKVVENRIQKETAFGKKIFFDGDVTTYERMQELSDNMYKNKFLVLRKVGSAENTLRIANIDDHFKKYKKVYIFDDVEYLDELKNAPNVEIVKDNSFLKDIKGTVIYHYSGYFRVWDKFDENNLNIYDRDIYPILKE